MTAIENVTSGRLILCQTKGYDLTPLVRTVSIQESICSSYIMGEIQLLDNDNVITGAVQIQPEDIFTIEFDSPNPFSSGLPYSCVMKVVEIKAKKSPENLELKIYTLSLMGEEFFIDKALTETQITNPMATGVEIVSKIHQNSGFPAQYTNQGQMDSSLQDGKQPSHFEQVSPLTAIGKIRDMQNYPQYPSGNVLYFMNRIGNQFFLNHVPLQHIYESAVVTGRYDQKTTWGYDAAHMGGGGGAAQAIISVVESSRRSMLDPNPYATGSNKATDTSMGKASLQTRFNLSQIVGRPRHMHNSNSRVPTEKSHAITANDAHYYALLLKSFPQYVVEIPLVSGINNTVGTTVWLELLLPRETTATVDPSGPFLITDLIHEVHNDQRQVTGRTILHCLKQGYPGLGGF